MKNIRFFAVLSSAVISASVFSGCSDHNSDSYIERPNKNKTAVTTAVDIVEWTTKAQETAETTTKKTKKKPSDAKMNTPLTAFRAGSQWERVTAFRTIGR